MLGKFILYLTCACLGVALAGSKTPEEALKNGNISGHIGAFFQQASQNDPTYGDLNAFLTYESQKFLGYRVGVSAWLVPKIYEGRQGDFDRAQDYFVISSLYINFYNQYEKFGFSLGRYGINEEWITHQNEALSVIYNKLSNISLSFAWVLRNAYTSNYYLSGFRRLFYGGGALLFRSEIQIPSVSIKLVPYLYAAPGVFISPGVKFTLHLPLKSGIYIDGNIHLLSYVASSQYYGQSSSSGLIWLEGLMGWSIFEIGTGLVSVGGGQGANRIDAFGQHSEFERTAGMFYGNAITPYGFISINFSKYILLNGKIRETFIDSKTILNWELNTKFKIQKNIEFGLGFLGMFNSTQATGYFNDTKNYIMVRGFVQYKF